MATFNAMPAMQSGANAGDAMGMTSAQMPGNGMGMEGFGHEMNFDESMLYVLQPGGARPPLPFRPRAAPSRCACLACQTFGHRD